MMNEARNTVMVVYYVSNKVASTTGLGLRLPHTMRRAGFAQFDGSVWFGVEEAVAALPMRDWREKGVRIEVVPFVAEQWSFVRDRAHAYLRREAEYIFKSFAHKSQVALDRFAAAEREASVKDVKRARGFAKGALRFARSRIVTALEAAVLFDLTGETREVYEALRNHIAAEAVLLDAIRVAEGADDAVA